MTEQLPLWQKLLAQRGILLEAQKAGWQPDGNGWRYPVFDGTSGEIIERVARWKKFDSTPPFKYLWKPKDALGRPLYYVLPGTIDAIEQSMGRCLIASGEPDVLAFRSAGARNALCWFGEGVMPATLVQDLQAIGAMAVEIYPDRDDAGLNWAKEIIVALRDSGITVHAYTLPGAAGSKMDINRLWIDCGFDADKFWDVIACCEPLEIDIPDSPFLPPRGPVKADDLPQGYYDAIEAALGVTAYKADGWSKPVKCPLKNHEHDKPGAYAAAWHKDKHIFSCLKCGDTDMLAKEIAAVLGVDWREFVEKSARPFDVRISPSNLPPRQPSSGQPKITFTFAEAAQTVLSELAGSVPENTYEPLPIPFRSIASLGGIARSIPAGKIVAVVADSGDGKTSFSESLWDYWNPLGFDGMVWGPEWTKEEYVYRAIQRHNGPSVMDIIAYKAWNSEAARGIPEHKRYGKPLAQEQIDKARAAIALINSWPGRMTFIERMNMTSTELIQRMNEVAIGALANGRRIAFAVLDYAQLLRAPGEKASERVDRTLSDFKAFCVDRQLVGVVASQIQKEAGRNHANGGASSQHDMQYARSDYFNLVITLSREIENGERTSVARVGIAKNSLGRNGETKLFMNGPRMLWTELESQTVSLNLDVKPISVVDRQYFGERDHDN